MSRTSASAATRPSSRFVEPDQVQPESGRDRSLPGSDRHRAQRGLEFRAKSPCDLRGAAVEAFGQERGVAGHGAAARECAKRCGDVGFGLVAVPRRVEIDLLQRIDRLDPILVRVVVEPALQLGVRRRRRRAAVEDELDLLAHAAPDDRVVALESHRERLAIIDLVAHPRVDQRLLLVGGRRTLPDALELHDEALDLLLRHQDLVRRGEPLAIEPAVEHEQQGAEQQEVDEWLPDESP